MDDFTADVLISWFKDLENQLQEFISSVPIHEQNMNTWSPRLATLTIDACGLIDSLWRYNTSNRIDYYNNVVLKDDFKLEHYGFLYWESLNQQKVILLQSPPQYIKPFEVWSNENNARSQSPIWWSTHNKFKHNRLEHIEKATLNIAINALAGLLAVIAIYPVQLVPALLRSELLESYGYNPEFILGEILKGDPFTIVTSLFALVLGEKNLPEDIREFRPAFYKGGNRLIKFFGRI